MDRDEKYENKVNFHILLNAKSDFFSNEVTHSLDFFNFFLNCSNKC